MKILPLAISAFVLASGCATINKTSDHHGIRIENSEQPLETVEIENTGWQLLRCIPLGSGDPMRPNERTCRLFRDTVTLQNNLDMLDGEMKRCNAKRVVNLTSHKTSENMFLILLTRRAYHTSAVLLK